MTHTRGKKRVPPLPDRESVVERIEAQFGLAIDNIIEIALEKRSTSKADLKAIVVIGSYAEGFANAYSDLDLLFVLAAGDSPFLPHSRIALDVGPNRNTIEIMTVTAAGAQRLISDFNHSGEAGSWERFLLHRIFTGCCLFDTGWFAAWSDCLAADQLRRLLCGEELMHGFKRIEDIAGLVVAQEDLNAAYKARGLLRNALDALLYKLGVTNPKRGARSIDHLRATLGRNSPVAMRYIELEFGCSVEDLGYRQYISQCLTFFQLANDAVVAQSIEPRALPRILQSRGFSSKQDLMFMRDPFVNVTAGNGKFAIRERNFFYEVSSLDVKFWIILAHASSKDEIENLAAAIFPGISDGRDIHAAAEQSVRVLKKLNVLRERD